VKNWDAVVIGAGIIGLSLAIELRKRGMTVLVVEKGQPGREASWAAGGMLADFPLEMPLALRELAEASARMYPAFVRELEAESGIKVDLRAEGTLVFGGEEHEKLAAKHPLPQPLSQLEPGLRFPRRALVCLYRNERSVDPRQLLVAAIATARQWGAEFSCGESALEVQVCGGKAAGVRTSRSQFTSGIVVNCAGAWAGQVGLGEPQAAVPTRPVKGHMLCLAVDEQDSVRHVVRTPDVYLIPRSSGRLVIGATQEEAGFDKQVMPETIQMLRQAAVDLVPKLADAPVLETWTGLRPGTPDKLPILGATVVPGYFITTGHFRDGILLAPITARVIGELLAGHNPDFDLSPFSPQRFGSSS
jgi:glycine oxidase